LPKEQHHGSSNFYISVSDSRPCINPKQRVAIGTEMISRKEKHLPTFAPSWPDSHWA